MIKRNDMFLLSKACWLQPLVLTGRKQLRRTMSLKDINYIKNKPFRINSYKTKRIYLF